MKAYLCRMIEGGGVGRILYATTDAARARKYSLNYIEAIMEGFGYPPYCIHNALRDFGQEFDTQLPYQIPALCQWLTVEILDIDT